MQLCSYQANEEPTFDYSYGSIGITRLTVLDVTLLLKGVEAKHMEHTFCYSVVNDLSMQHAECHHSLLL